MCEVTKNVRSGLVLAQEPWTYATKIRSKLRGWNLFQGIEKGNRPRAFIYVTPDLCCSLIPMFSNEIFWQLELTMCAKTVIVSFRIGIQGSQRTSFAQFIEESVSLRRK